MYIDLNRSSIYPYTFKKMQSSVLISPILQNIAARNPQLSGHVLPQPSDPNLLAILAVRLSYAFLPAMALPLATVADLRACFLRGPLVGDRDAWLCGVFVSREERDAVAAP
jgi:hypothetical protein